MRGPISPDRWTKIEYLFIEAAQLRPEERDAFLDRECDGDEVLWEEVSSLLRYDTSEPVVMDSIQAGAAELVHGESLEGTTLGPWRVEREIGRGGMSVVYLAIRADGQFAKQAAIKLIKRGMDTAAVIERVRRERRILAALDHPYIARLLDGGATPEGRPYLVMDYVEGLPIDRWCAERELTIERRCELIAKVCDAVAYAHRMLVIHRDLKPGNILVGVDGNPKLLDFGIAKLLSDEASSDAAPETRLPLRPLTPEYASPEQIGGGTVGTAADVYSLGVILFELLAGARPTGEDERASAIAVRNGMPQKWARRLEGDLDTVLLTALRIDPTRRYAGAERLAEDLRRHLNGQPVAAREESVLYRWGKFLRRNRAAALATTLVAVSLVAGMFSTLWQARRADAERRIAESQRAEAQMAAAHSAVEQKVAEGEQRRAEGEHAEAERQRLAAETERALAEKRFSEVRELAGKFLFDFHDSIASLPGSTAARRKVVETALRYYDSLAKETGDNRELTEEIARGYDRLGDVLGNPYQANLGDTAGAAEAYGKAKALRDRIVDPSPAFLCDRIRGAVRRSQMMFVGGTDFNGAEQTLVQAIAIGQHGAAAREYEVKDALANAWSTYGDLKQRAGKQIASIPPYTAVLEIWTALAREKRNPESEESGISMAHTKLADTWSRMGRSVEAYREITAALEVDRALASAKPGDFIRQRKLYIDFLVMSMILRSADPATLHSTYDRVSALESAADIAERLAAADPENAARLTDVGQAHSMLDAALLDRKDYAGALVHARRALESLEQHARLTGESFDNIEGMVQANERLGDALREAGQFPEAMRQYDRAAVYLEQLAKKSPGVQVVDLRRAELFAQRGKAYLMQKEWARAIRELEQANEFSARMAKNDPGSAEFRNELADQSAKIARCQAELQAWAEARASAKSSLDALRDLAALRPLRADEEELRAELTRDLDSWPAR